MNRAWLAALVAVLALAGCESRFNPVNWFGGSTEEATLAPRRGYVETVDRRPLVQQVLSMKVDRVPGGAIVSAIGLPPTQGHWATDLVPETTTIGDKPVADNGVLAFQFRLLPPPGPRRSGTPVSRELSASTFLTDQELLGVRTIVVRGQTNQFSARR